MSMFSSNINFRFPSIILGPTPFPSLFELKQNRKVVIGNEAKTEIKQFPLLNKYLRDPAILLTKLLNNEAEFERLEDTFQDGLAERNIIYSSSATLGLAQISTQGLSELRNQFLILDRYIEKKGFKNTLHDNQKALLDPGISVVAAAAILEGIISVYQKRNIEITDRSLAYGYNPDVWIDDKGELYNSSLLDRIKSFHKPIKKAWPPNIDLKIRGHEVFKKSEHVANVLKLL